MAKYFPGLNQLSFDPNSFAGSSQNSGTMKSFNRLSFNIKVGTETKALIMKNFHDIGTRLSYVILSTDDSLDPDKATDLATILEYQLQDNEFLACVELHGRNPALQVGNMHQIFTKNLRSWDFYEATGGDPDPREVRVTFNAAKEPNVVSFTLNSQGASAGLSSFEWNGTKYSCKYDQLSTTPYLLQLPSLGLKYKHDNTVYTMEDSSYVKVSSKQRINGLKLFTVLPELAVEPTKDSQAVSKGYVDTAINNIIGDPNLYITIKLEVNSSWGGVNHVTLELEDGFIEPKYLEDVHPSKAIEPALVVWRYRPASEATKKLERKEKAFFETYQLQEGEYIGTVSYAELLGPCKSHSTETYEYYEPFNTSYLVSGKHGLQPVLSMSIKGLEKKFKCLSFYTGSSSNGTNAGTGHTADFARNGETCGSDVQGTNSLTCTPLKKEILGLEGIVTLATAQTITGAKTFDFMPSCNAEPKENNHLATKQYVDSALGGGYDIAVTIEQEFGSVWCGLTKIGVDLVDGVLEPKYMEDILPSAAKEPVLLVWSYKDKASERLEIELKTKEFIKDYKLQKGEYFGTISFADILGPYKSHTSKSYRNPFTGQYLYNGSTGKHPIMKLTIDALSSKIKSVHYLNGTGASYQSTVNELTFEVNRNKCAGAKTGDGTQASPFVFTPENPNILDKEKFLYVPVDGNATIFDTKIFSNKTFITDPDQSSEMVSGQVATTENLKAVGLIGKAFPDTQYICLWGDLREVKKNNDRDTKNGVYEMSGLEMHTESGQLYLKYIENTPGPAVPNSSKPQTTLVLKCVLSRKKEWDSSTELPYQTQSFMNNYVLQPGEYFAQVRLIAGAWRSGLSSGATSGVAPYGMTGNFAGLFADTAKSDNRSKFTCYMAGALNADTSSNKLFRYAEIIINNAPSIGKIKLASGRETYFSITAATGGINTINAFISTDKKFSSFDAIEANVGTIPTECADNSTKLYFDDSKKSIGYITELKNLEFPLNNYIGSESQGVSSNTAFGYLQAVTISNNQDIAGSKTFLKPVICAEAPAENTHLTNKKYVDEEIAKLVARIEALEAVKP